VSGVQLAPRLKGRCSEFNRVFNPAVHSLQVTFFLYFNSKDGAATFVGSSESLLYSAMELNRYRQVVYLPDVALAQVQENKSTKITAKIS
jgi:hypothetical protein